MLVKVRDSLYTKTKRSKLNILVNVLIGIVLIVLLAEICFMANYSGVYVVGDSMQPTLIGAESEDVKGGDYVYIDKYAEPDYGDIVVVKYESGYIIKRAVAFGGDTVKLVEGKLYIRHFGKLEFELVEESYISPDNNHPEYANNTFPRDEDGYLVQEGHMFLLGDNRDVSFDSRKFGSLPLSRLQGVVADWSIKFKSACTSFHNFFAFGFGH